MGGFNDKAVESAILAVVRNGATVHLLGESLPFDADEDDLLEAEVDGPGYETAEVTSESFTSETNMSDETVTTTNDSILTFGIAQEDWEQDITHMAIADDDKIMRFSADQAYRPDKGEQIELPAEIIDFTLGASVDNE